MLPHIITNTLIPGCIFSLLCYGAYSDYKTQCVSNWITYSIIMLSFSLIAINTANITWYHFLFIAMLFILFVVNKFGGADFKAIVPIILALPLIQFIYFMVMVVVVGGILMHPRLNLIAKKESNDNYIEVRLKLFPAIAIVYLIIALM
jgi:Flp pilus assembly protein protease CpaA